MNYKTSNRVFLWTIVTVFLYMALLYLVNLSSPSVVTENEGVLTLLDLVVLLIPSIVALVVCRGQEKPNEVLRIHRFKISSALMLVLVVIMLQPAYILLNLISQLVAPNLAASGTTTMDVQLIITTLVTIFIPPVVEEIIFRGVIFHGFDKSCGFLTAAIFSTLFFALYHENFNQVVYALLVGFFLAMAAQATGSIVATMLMHLLFNLFGLVINPSIVSSLGSLIIKESGGFTTQYYVILVVLMVIFTPLAVIALRWVAKHEGRQGVLAFRKEKGTEEKSVQNIATPSMIIGIVMSVAFIIYMIIRAWR